MGAGVSPPSPFTLTTVLDSVRCRLATTDRESEFSIRVTEIVVQGKRCGGPCRNLPFIQFDHDAKSVCCLYCHVCTCRARELLYQSYVSVRPSYCDIVSQTMHRSSDFSQTLTNPSV